MAGYGECNVAAEFPYVKGMGIISVVVRPNTQIIKTSTNKILIGPTIAELSITAYGSKVRSGGAGRAGVTYEWLQKYDCMADIVYFIPRGGDRAYKEGDTSGISMATAVSNTGVSASASSGPQTVYLSSSHSDGYNFSYSGDPIPVSGRNTSAGELSRLIGGETYLTNFTWQHTPPNLPTVSYSFIGTNKKSD